MDGYEGSTIYHATREVINNMGREELLAYLGLKHAKANTERLRKKAYLKITMKEEA